MTPGAAPREVVARIQREIAQIVNLPEMKERLAADGMTVVASPPDQYAELVNREIEKYGRIIRAAGVKAVE